MSCIVIEWSARRWCVVDASADGGSVTQVQFKSRSSKYLYSNVKPSFLRWPHFS